MRLFVTCMVDQIAPQVGEAVVRIFDRLGIAVDVPRGQTCCGQPAFNGGFWADARRVAKYTISLLDGADTPIVIPSGSCGDMIIHRYPELLQAEPAWRARAERVAANTFELTHYLVDRLGITDVGARYRGTLAYHASCHGLRGLGLRSQAQELLAHVREATVVPLPRVEECCGFGGLFSIKYGPIAADMLNNKIAHLRDCGADRLVGGDVSCLLHINGGLQRLGLPQRAVHIAEILASS